MHQKNHDKNIEIDDKTLMIVYATTLFATCNLFSILFLAL